MHRMRLLWGLLAAATITAGCALPYRASTDGLGNEADTHRLPFGARTTPGILRERAVCAATTADTLAPALPLLSPGDRVSIVLEDGEEFAGSYAVGFDGRLRLPYLPPIPVLGLSIDAALERVSATFVAEDVLTGNGPRVGMVPVLWAAVQVNVTGAVYSPGPVVVNDRTHVETRPDLKTRSGDLAPDRNLSAALRAAGGLRPDADVANVILIRDGVRTYLDLRPLLDGGSAYQPPLLAGDRIEIPSTGIYQEGLARPSAITSPGYRIYVSNLTIPSPSNAQSAVAGEATRLPTGARLSHALASANCIGGTHLTNAGRSALLVSRNPVSTEVTSYLYRVYEVTRYADDPVNNPYLLPEDAVACFDSSVTVTRDLARTALDVLLPVQVLRNIQRGEFWYD